jgi:hypothetical protein
MLFTVHYTNFGYDAFPIFRSFLEAFAYGKSKGFDFTIHDENYTTVGIWTVFGGLRDLREEG